MRRSRESAGCMFQNKWLMFKIEGFVVISYAFQLSHLTETKTDINIAIF